MTRGLDNDEWLRNIGAVTVAEDEDPGEVTGDDLDDLGGADDAVEPGDYDAADRELTQSSVVFLDDDEQQGEAPTHRDEPPRRFTPWVLAAFAAAAAVATVVTLVVTVANSPSDESSSATPSAVAPPRIVEVAPPKPPVNTDGPLPFTASADCPPGSTAAQSVGDPNSTTPWVCVRSVDGQVLTIDLGRTYVITAVSIVPGAVLKVDANPDQADPWLQHRVVTRVQWQFNDTDRTVKNQNTGNVRGEAVEAIRPGVLASKITVIIQETSRPPAIAPTNAPKPTPAGAGPSILGDILGGDQSPAAPVTPVLPGTEPSRDPADGTFAVSSIKIIGHKAV